MKQGFTTLYFLALIPFAGLNFTSPNSIYKKAVLFNYEEQLRVPLSFLKPIFKVGSFLTPAIVRDFYKIFLDVPARKLVTPTNIKHASIDETQASLQNSILPYCSIFGLFSDECLSKETYTDVSAIEDENFDSLTLVTADLKRRKIVVSYRASITPLNWKHNLDYQLIDIPTAPYDVRVHHGFYTIFLSTYHKTRRAVSTLLKKPEYQNFTLSVTGYSLGAAVAMVSTHDWYQLLQKHNYRQKLEIVSYLGPRVGNEHFANYLSSLDVSITRYTNKNDIVSQLPPRSFGYVHAGVEIHQRHTYKDEFVVCSQDFDEDPDCSLKEHSLSVLPHMFPFNNPTPLPPYS